MNMRNYHNMKIQTRTLGLFFSEPPRKFILVSARGLSLLILQRFIRFLFSHPTCAFIFPFKRQLFNCCCFVRLSFFFGFVEHLSVRTDVGEVPWQ